MWPFHLASHTNDELEPAKPTMGTNTVATHSPWLPREYALSKMNLAVLHFTERFICRRKRDASRQWTPQKWARVGEEDTQEGRKTSEQTREPRLPQSCHAWSKGKQRPSPGKYSASQAQSNGESLVIRATTLLAIIFPWVT